MWRHNNEKKKWGRVLHLCFGHKWNLTSLNKLRLSRWDVILASGSLQITWKVTGCQFNLTNHLINTSGGPWVEGGFQIHNPLRGSLMKNYFHLLRIQETILERLSQNRCSYPCAILFSCITTIYQRLCPSNYNWWVQTVWVYNFCVAYPGSTGESTFNNQDSHALLLCCLFVCDIITTMLILPII